MHIVAAVLLPVSGMAQAFYEPFLEVSDSAPPPGWTAVGVRPDQSEAPAAEAAITGEPGSIEFPGLKKSQGDSLGVRIASQEASFLGLISPLLPFMERGPIYYSFLLVVDDLGQLREEGGNNGLIMISNQAAGNSVGGHGQGAVGLAADGTGGFRLSIASGHHGKKGGATEAPVSLQVGKPVFVVVGFDREGTAGVARLWINPTPGESEPEPAAVAEPDAHVSKTLDVIYIGGQTMFRMLPAALRIDEIRVGSSWADVTPAD